MGSEDEWRHDEDFLSCLLNIFLILLMVRDCSWQFQAVTDKKALKFPHGTSKLSYLMSGASLEFKSWSLTLLGKINISFLIYIIKKSSREFFRRSPASAIKVDAYPPVAFSPGKNKSGMKVFFPALGEKIIIKPFRSPSFSFFTFR